MPTRALAAARLPPGDPAWPPGPSVRRRHGGGSSAGVIGQFPSPRQPTPAREESIGAGAQGPLSSLRVELDLEIKPQCQECTRTWSLVAGSKRVGPQARTSCRSRPGLVMVPSRLEVERSEFQLVHGKHGEQCWNIKKEKTGLLEDLKRLKQDKQALEADLEKMKRERDQAREQVRTPKGTCRAVVQVLVQVQEEQQELQEGALGLLQDTDGPVFGLWHLPLPPPPLDL
ncbi:hypothetical protein CB1_001637001 [Camelus ferus]|nr:hypothetical protein CB1_001637001 [Camelus ferus]